MELKDLVREFDSLQMEMKLILSVVGYEMDNVLYNQENLDQSFIRNEYYTIINKLQDIDHKLTYLKKNIKEEARLKQNSRDRFEFPSGFKFTSGSHCEILTTSNFGEKYWLFNYNRTQW